MTAPFVQRQPAPERAPERRVGPPLRVLPAPRSRSRRRLGAVLLVAGVVVGIFALVASHVVLTQGQFRLDRLKARAAVEEARYQRLRLQVAELESPSRVVAAAQERLGMVPPPSVTYLSPTGATSAPAGGPDGAGPESAAGEDDYARVKRSLTGSH